jgi:hypothetical protein
MISSQPYGLREDARETVSENLKIMVNRNHRCIGRDQGAMLAMVYGINPKSGVQKDYGSVMIVAMGVGACGRADRYISGVVEESLNKIITVIGDTK